MKKKSTVYSLSSTAKQAGLTLIEVLVSLTILVVIGTVAIPNLRQFNSDQELTNTTSNLIRLLQQTQSSSQSQIACVNSLPLATNNPAIFWDLRIFKDAANVTKYQLQAECINGATGVPNALPTIYETNSLTNVTLDVRYSRNNSSSLGCTLPAVVQFITSSASQTGSNQPLMLGQVVQLSCAGTSITDLTQVFLNVGQTGFTTQTIIVESNGVVHQ